MTYDCTAEVKGHISLVQFWMAHFVNLLTDRAVVHDASKLNNMVEKQTFDTWTPELKTREAGTPEYQEALDQMGLGLKMHYQANSHHPEHYELWRCPVCQKVFDQEEARIDNRFSGDVRLCPACCADGTIMECTLEPAGIYGMNLYDVVEMVCDWMAVCEKKGVPVDMDYLQGRFKMSPQLRAIIENTFMEVDVETVRGGLSRGPFLKGKQCRS